MPRLKHSNNSENPSPNQYRAPYKTAHQKHLRKHIAPFCEVRSFLIPARPFRSHLATVALERPSAFPVLEMALTFSDTRTRELPYHVLATSATRESNMSTSVSSRRRPIMRLMRSIAVVSALSGEPWDATTEILTRSFRRAGKRAKQWTRAPIPRTARALFKEKAWRIPTSRAKLPGPTGMVTASVWRRTRCHGTEESGKTVQLRDDGGWNARVEMWLLVGLFAARFIGICWRSRFGAAYKLVLILRI